MMWSSTSSRLPFADAVRMSGLPAIRAAAAACNPMRHGFPAQTTQPSLAWQRPHLFLSSSSFLLRLFRGRLLTHVTQQQQACMHSAAHLGRGQRFKRCAGVLLPPCERGFEQQLVLGAEAHGFHQLRHVIDFEQIDDVSSEAATRNSSSVAFKFGAFGGNLKRVSTSSTVQITSKTYNQSHIRGRQVGE